MLTMAVNGEASIHEKEPLGGEEEDGEQSINASESGDENRARGNWTRQIDFFITCVGYCVGLGNIWRFPYLCMRNGGGAFLIPYFLFLFIGGMPMFFMELGIGQFSSRSALHVWDMCPLFKGLGWGMILVSGLVVIYYQTIITWVLYYLVMSFQNPLPWAHCDNAWNTPNCTKRGADIANMSVVNTSAFFNYTEDVMPFSTLPEDNTSLSLNLTGKAMTPSEEFWQYNILEMSDGIDNLNGLRWQLVVCHLVGWIVNMLCVMKGVKSVGKVVYVTATTPYIFLVILLVRGLTLDGAVDGIAYYVKPDFSQLLKFKVWTEACMQIFYSLGPAWGGIITMASYNKFRHNMYRDAVVVPIINSFTSFFSGFVTFSVIGFMAKEAKLPVDKVITSGPGLAFIAYPEAISKLPFSPAWAVLFFLMLYLIGLDTQFATFETVISGMVDEFPNVFGGKKIWVMIGTGTISALAGLIFCTRAGIYFFQICDWYCGAFSVMVIATLECIVIGYLYGGKRFLYDLETMLGRRPCLGWIGLLAGVTPVSLLVCLGYAIFQFDSPYYGDYQYPLWAILFGWALASISMLPIPGTMIRVIVETKGTFLQRLKRSITPPSTWGPALEKNRKGYRYAVSEDGGKQDNLMIEFERKYTTQEDFGEKKTNGII